MEQEGQRKRSKRHRRKRNRAPKKDNIMLVKDFGAHCREVEAKRKAKWHPVVESTFKRTTHV